jgi:hypothetical protein
MFNIFSTMALTNRYERYVAFIRLSVQCSWIQVSTTALTNRYEIYAAMMVTSLKGRRE